LRVLLIAAGGLLAATGVFAAPSTPGLSPIAALGEQLFKDESLSVSGRLACQTCHQPEFAHAAPPTDLVSRGGPGMDIPGIRNSPSIRYASFTPPFGFDEEGAAFGGLFRDGRAPSLVEQAKLPFLDVREMANPSADAVVARLRRSANAERFRAVFGAAVLDDAVRAFQGLAVAIAQYEAELPDFHRFDSKYDAWLAGKVQFTEQEARGLELFEDPEKGNCAECHPNRPRPDGSPPLFTDFTYDNVGLPRNARIPANADPGFHDLGATSAAPSRCRRSATWRAPLPTSTTALLRRCARSSTSTRAATRTPATGSRRQPRASGSSTTCRPGWPVP
jgi:cytochrome c peroxidase